MGLAVRCPAGILIHTGDFKIDTTPVDGDMIDLTRFAEYGKKGVLALFQDSTNAERPGYTMSEKTVGESFVNLFRKAGKRRIVVATFASNLVIITTGSQGEPMSALTKMAFREHRKVVITPNDYVIISATPIPGNEKMVGNVVNELMKQGVEVIYEKMYEVHVSGHACQEELKLMMGIVKPKYFIPVHGEQKHLQKHALLAQAMGYSKENIYVGTIGDHIEISQSGIKYIDTVQSGEVYVDGIGVGDVGNIVLNDRKRLSQDGLIIVVATINTQTGLIESGPDVVSRGFVYVRENEDLMNSVRNMALKIIDETYDKKYHDWNTVKIKLRDDITRLMYEKTKRSPMVLPVLMEI